MKKRVFTTILMFLMYMILSSTSCTSSSAQSNENSVAYYQDTLKKGYDTTVLYFSKEEDSKNLVSLQEVPKAVIKKEIKSMEKDTLWKMKSDSAYRQLEKTEKVLKQQQSKIDSLLIIKKKK